MDLRKKIRDWFLILASCLFIGAAFYFIGMNFIIFFAYVPIFLLLSKEKNTPLYLVAFLIIEYIILANFISAISFYVKASYLTYVGLVLAMTIVQLFIFFVFSFLFRKLKLNIKDRAVNLFIISQLGTELIMYKGQLAYPWFVSALPAAVYPWFISICSLFGQFFVSVFIMGINFSFYIMLKRGINIFRQIREIKKTTSRDRNLTKDGQANLVNVLSHTKNRIVIRELKGYFFVLVFLFAFPLLWFYLNPYRNSGMETDVNITVAQPDIPLNFRYRFKYFQQMVNRMVDTNYELKGKTDLVIWSKSSYPNFFMSSYNNKEMIIRSVRENNLRIILGFPYKEMTDGERENHNSAGFIDRDGSISLYHKIQIVPFGEFIPYTDLFPFLEDIAPEVGITQVPGTLKDPFVLSKNGRDYKFYPTICYEGIFTYLFHEMRQRGAEFFINITNDSYYDTTYEPRMHLYLNVFRAVEYNVQLFRASSTGISAIINPEGEIVKKIPLNAEGMIDANLVVPTKKTFYEVFGYYVIMTLRIILSYCLLLGALYFFADKIIIRIRNAKNPDNTDI